MSRRIEPAVRGLILISLWAGHDATHAQPATRSIDESELVTEVIVTAQRRQQKLQDVPVAVSALQAEQLETRGIGNVYDLGSLVPNLQVSTAPANNTGPQISIRGGVQINPALFWDPTVGIYLDGVYIGKMLGSNFDMMDLERIEVLRGPQGTLYGRNTLAGAISLVTRAPSGEFQGRARAGLGNYDQHSGELSLDLPRFGIASASIGLRSEKRDGWTRTTPPSSVEELDNRDSEAARFALDLAASDTFQAAYRFDYSNIDQQPGHSYLVRADSTILPFLTPYVHAGRPGTVSVDAPTYERSRITGHALTLTWNVSEHDTLKSISAYRTLDWSDGLDLDGTSLPVVQTSRVSDYDSRSQELQLVGERGRINYVSGLYYFEDDGITSNPQSFFFGSLNFDSRYGYSTQAWSGYGQMDLQATDALTLTAGLRYTHERKGIERQLGVNFAAGTPFTVLIPAGTTAKETFSATTPLLSVAYRISSSVNVYAKYAEGFKSGGFNGEYGDTGLPPDPRGLAAPSVIADNITETRTPFDPEKVKSYEIGLKTTSSSGHVQLNAAAFQNKTDDMQLSIFRATGAASGIIRNAGKATARGVELDGVWLVGQALRAQLSYGYLDAQYDELIDRDVNVADNRAFIHAPKHTFNVVLDARLMQTRWGALRMLADYTWKDSFYTYPYQLDTSGPQFNPGAAVAGDTRVDSVGTLNLRLGIKEIPLNTATAEIALWARNVADAEHIANYIDFGPTFGNLTTAYFLEPRTYGIELGIRW